MKAYSEKQIADWFLWMKKKYPNSKMREALEEVETAFFGDEVFENSMDDFVRRVKNDMTIHFLSEINVTVTFDNYFDMKMIGTIDEIFNRMHWAFLEYGFNGAVIVSNETGEVIAETDNG